MREHGWPGIEAIIVLYTYLQTLTLEQCELVNGHVVAQ